MEETSTISIELLFYLLLGICQAKIGGNPPHSIIVRHKERTLQGRMANENPPSNLGIKFEISRLWSIPDHQQGIRCKAPRSDD